MTSKQSELFNKISEVLDAENASVEDIATAACCIMTSYVVTCDNPRTLPANIKNLVGRQFDFFNDVRRGKQINMPEFVPEYIDFFK